MKKTNRKRNITLVIIYMVVIIFFLSGFSIGKEMTKINIKSTGSIAEPILKIEKSDTLYINNDTEKEIYEFTVKNYDEQGNISQVDLEYYIEILTNISSEFSLKIYKDNEEINLKENKTEKFTIVKNEKQEDCYKIEIICDEKKQVKELVQNVQMKIYSEQKRR